MLKHELPWDPSSRDCPFVHHRICRSRTELHAQNFTHGSNLFFVRPVAFTSTEKLGRRYSHPANQSQMLAVLASATRLNLYPAVSFTAAVEAEIAIGDISYRLFFPRVPQREARYVFAAAPIRSSTGRIYFEIQRERFTELRASFANNLSTNLALINANASAHPLIPSCMKALSIVRSLAVLSLAIVSVESVIGAAHAFQIAANIRAMTSIFNLAVWGFLTWKVWSRPRNWGLGVGILVLLMIPFQSWLFSIALENPMIREQGHTWATFLAFYELPLFLAGVFGISLRFIHPAPGTPVTITPQP